MTTEEKHKEFLDRIEPHLDGLYLYARALTKNREDAEDLVNDSILAGYEYFGKLKDRSTLKLIFSRQHEINLGGRSAEGNYSRVVMI